MIKISFKKTKISLKKSNLFFIPIFILLFSYWVFEVNSDAVSMGSKNYETEIFDKKIEGIAKVSDGDTIKIDEERIRLLWIDAPETKQNCLNENKAEYACGLMSTEFLVNMANEKNVVCYYSKRDIYKRLLAECFVGEVSINKEMLRNGMAVIYSFKKTDDRLKELQNEAKENERGIWKGSFELPQDYRKRMRGVKK